MSRPIDAQPDFVAGVPVFWTEGLPGSPPFAAVVFRVGQADETLFTAGTTHLVEHLVLPSRSTPGLEVNGQIDLTSTMFWYSGEPEDILRELGRSIRLLRTLPRWRLAQERTILLTEAGGRSQGFVPHIHGLRFGSRHFGLVGHPEYGLDHVGLGAAQEWADARFTRSQCAVVLTFPPPEGLEDVLAQLGDAPAVALPEPTPIPYVEFPSACPAGLEGYVGASFVGARAYDTTVAQRLLEQRLRDTLRYRGGLSYSVTATYEPLGSGVAIATLLVDTMQANTEAVRNGFVATWDGLARTGPTSTELDAVKREFSRDPTESGELIGYLVYRAHSHLIGHVARSRPEELEVRAGLTPAAVGDALATAYESVMLLQPHNVPLPGGRFRPYPMDSPHVINDGRRFKRAGLPFRRTGEERELVVSDEGLTLHGEGYARTILRNDTTAVIRHQDEVRQLWGGDGFMVVVDPAIWRNGDDLPPLMDSFAPDVSVDLTSSPPIFDDPTLHSGAEALDKDDFETAHRVFVEGTERHPDGPLVWAYRGAAAMGLARHRESLEASSRACALQPAFAWAQRLRSKALWSSGRHDEAIEAARAAVELGMSDEDGLSDFAYYLAESGDVSEARRVVELLDALYHDTPATLFATGWTAQAEGDFELAETALRKVIELTPDDSYAHNNLGWVVLQTGRTEQALQSFERALELSDTNPYAPYNRATALALLGRSDEAASSRQTLEQQRLEAAVHSLEHDPNDRDALSERTERLRALGDLEGARQAARDHVGRYPDDLLAVIDLAQLEARLGDLDRAHAALEQAEVVCAKDRHVLALRLELEAHRSVSDESRAMLEAALADHPHNPPLLIARARVALADDDHAGARGALDRLLENSPLSCCGLALSGRVTLRGGDETAAREALRLSRATNPACFAADDLEQDLGGPGVDLVTRSEPPLPSDP